MLPSVNSNAATLPAPPLSGAPAGLRSVSEITAKHATGKIGAASLLAVGVVLWNVTTGGNLGAPRQWVGIALAVAAAAVAVKLPRLRAAVEFIRRPSVRARRVTAILLAVVAAAYLYATARLSGLELRPVLHDEYAYSLQARMIAAGHLWMPAHEAAASFESFHLITDGAYAAKYSPGTAMFLAAGLKVGVPGWAVSLALSAAAVGLLSLLLTRSVDGLAAIAGVAVLVAMPAFRRMAVGCMSHPPMLFLMLLAVWAYACWRDDGRRQWILLIGAAIGMAAITRPLDGACLGVVLAVAIMLRRNGASVRQRLSLAAIGLATVVPFVVLQLVVNYGVTGQVARLPWNAYAERDDPYDTMGAKSLDPLQTPASTLPQKVEFAEAYTLAAYRKAAGVPVMQRLIAGPPAWTLADVLPFAPLMVLLPLGLRGVGRDGRWVACAVAAGLALAYTAYTFYFPHYAISAAPGVIVVLLVGAVPPEGRGQYGGIFGVGACFGITAVSLASLPEVAAYRGVAEFDGASHLREIDRRLERIEGPALVLFRFTPGDNVHVEPVYNVDAAWPDDARVIRAHDRGGELNGLLFAYYARRSPGRKCYLYDRAARGRESLSYLGTALGLANAGQQP
jgi:4-amino-4-deoxy-L-arabinose transferase-like glycosyltransferase